MNIYENIYFFIYLCHFWDELALGHDALHCNALGWIAFLGLGWPTLLIGWI